MAGVTRIRRPSVLLAVIVAVAATTILAGVPRPGDVCFTSRAVHDSPIGNPNTVPKLTTDEAAKAFHATRLDWVYTVDAAFMANASANGIPVTAAINANVPDKIDGHATYEVGRILDLYGNKLTAPWMRTWSVPPNYGCINNPDYLAILFSRAAELLRRGATGLQHDDPYSNYEAVRWKHGGCYCSHCMKKFGQYAARRGLANSSAFDYRQYLVDKGGYGKGSGALREAFEQFQFDSVVKYQRALREFLEGVFGRGNVTLSCNNPGVTWSAITEPFDFGMSELAHSQCTPDQLRGLMLPAPVGTLPAGKLQVVTMPKSHEEPNTAEKVLTRAAMALVTALGGHMLVPWDIYLPTPNAIRFYGNVSDFADLYAFERAAGARLVGGYPRILHTWAATSVVSTIPAEGIYWVLRAAGDSETVGEAVPKCPARAALHAVDWLWPRDAKGNASSQDIGRVEWPLPATPATQASFAVDFSSLCGALVVVAANVTLSTPVFPTSAAGFASTAVPVDIQGTTVTFNASVTAADAAAGMRPWAVFELSLAYGG